MQHTRTEPTAQEVGLKPGDSGYITVLDVAPIAVDVQEREAWDAEGNVGGSVDLDIRGLTPAERDAYFGGR